MTEKAENDINYVNICFIVIASLTRFSFFYSRKRAEIITKELALLQFQVDILDLCCWFFDDKFKS